MRTGRVLAVVGAQYGSEGKGVIVAHLANEYQVHVRVGGPNAGHSFFHKGRVFKMQVIPCGWVNPDATLVLGRGMLISIEQLQKELDIIEAVDPTIYERLKIDPFCGILSPHHHEAEGGIAGDLHRKIGSTGEGVGAARLDRIRRDPSRFTHFYQVARGRLEGLVSPNTPAFLTSARENGQNTLLEGAQGAALSLIHGPWPYVTSHDTNSAQLAADIGLPPRFIDQCLLVMRTLPIRVAGNSGPLNEELTWDEVSRRVGKTVEERTTVTKKIRRIGEWDESLIRQAVLLNAPTSVAVTFLDYLNPEDEGKTDMEQLSEKSRSFLEYVRILCDAPVIMAGTGGDGFKVAIDAKMGPITAEDL